MMCNMNTNVDTIDPTERKTRKPRAPSRRMRRLVDLLARSGLTQKKCAEECGFNPDYVSRLMQKPQFLSLIQSRARDILGQGTVRAAARVAELIDSDSSKTSLEASVFTLKVAGIAPSDTPGASLHLSVNVAPGYVIDLSEPPVIEGKTPVKNGAPYG